MTTFSKAIYIEVYTTAVSKGVLEEKAEKTAKRAETRYLQGQYDTPIQLIETMIEEAQK